MLIRILVIFAFCFSVTAQAAPVILIYGDSLSAGYGLPQNAGWANLLAHRLQQKKLNYHVVNASISGETTLGGLYRIEQTLATHKPAIVIVELGANDGLRGLSLDATRNNLNGIIQACRKHKAKVVIVGMQLPPNYGKTYTEKFQRNYVDLAKSYKLRLVPFMMEGFAGRRELFQGDNLHPTVEAQPLILDNIWKALQPLLK